MSLTRKQPSQQERMKQHDLRLRRLEQRTFGLTDTTGLVAWQQAEWDATKDYATNALVRWNRGLYQAKRDIVATPAPSFVATAQYSDLTGDTDCALPAGSQPGDLLVINVIAQLTSSSPPFSNGDPTWSFLFGGYGPGDSAFGPGSLLGDVWYVELSAADVAAGTIIVPAPVSPTNVVQLMALRNASPSVMQSHFFQYYNERAEQAEAGAVGVVRFGVARWTPGGSVTIAGYDGTDYNDATNQWGAVLGFEPGDGTLLRDTDAAATYTVVDLDTNYEYNVAFQIIDPQAPSYSDALPDSPWSYLGDTDSPLPLLVGRQAVAIGDEAKGAGDWAVALGVDARATADDAIAIGDAAGAYWTAAIAIGESTYVDYPSDGRSSVAIGDGAYVEGKHSVALSSAYVGGYHGPADEATSLGWDANVSANRGIAIGKSSKAPDYKGVSTASGATDAIAIGTDADSEAVYGVALGANTLVDTGHDGSAAIGTDSTGAGAASTASDEIVLGTANHTVNVPGALVVNGTPITGGGGGGGGGAGVLADVVYNPSTAVVAASKSSTTLADIDATNLAVTFTAPASGKVKVTCQTLWADANSADTWWGLRNGSTEVALVYMGFDAALVLQRQVCMVVAGLTPGNSYTFKWAYKVGSGNALIWYGDNGSTNRYGPALMLVEELP